LEAAMDTKPACGPQRDPDFFKEIYQLFAKYPEAASRYAVKCRRLELDILKVDFSRQVGVTRVEDGRIVTEFLDRDQFERSGDHQLWACCEWDPEDSNSGCSFICPV
jgi:hypothetical protein